MTHNFVRGTESNVKQLAESEKISVVEAASFLQVGALEIDDTELFDALCIIKRRATK